MHAYLLRCHMVQRFGQMPVGRIVAVDVQAWVADLHRTNLSESTVTKAYRLLKGLIDGVVYARLIAPSPGRPAPSGARARRPLRAVRPRWPRVPDRRRSADAAEQLPRSGMGAGHFPGRHERVPIRLTRRRSPRTSGSSLKALMARIGRASARAALRYQHVIDGQDADIVSYLERFGDEPSVPSRAHDEPPVTVPGGHVVGTQWARRPIRRRPKRPSQVSAT